MNIRFSIEKPWRRRSESEIETQPQSNRQLEHLRIIIIILILILVINEPIYTQTLTFEIIEAVSVLFRGPQRAKVKRGTRSILDFEPRQETL